MNPEYASTAGPDKEKTAEELLSEVRVLKARNALLEESEAKAAAFQRALVSAGRRVERAR